MESRSKHKREKKIMTLQKLISALPNELILIIRRLTYKSQQKELLYDISHFYKSKLLS